jgi:hypothetical protein
MSEIVTVNQNGLAKPQERVMFEDMYSHARVLAQSSIVPQHLRPPGEPETAIANCFVAMQLAREMNENPINVLQNIYFVGGKAAWSSQYMIARANRSKKFKGGLRFSSKGANDDLTVTCWAIDADTEERLEKTVTMRMAIAEGWGKGGSKYKTMPEQMLTYRAAAFFIRVYCPEVMIGPAHSVDELSDEVLPPVAEQKPKLTLSSVVENSKPVEVKTVEPTPTPKAEQPKAEPITSSDTLTNLIDKLESLGGLATFLEECGCTVEDITNTSKATRAAWCDKINAEIKRISN